MTRVLVFDGPKGARRFALLYQVLLAGGNGKGDRGAATIRQEARLLDLLDGVSVAVNGNPLERTLAVEGEAVTVTQEDFKLLTHYAESAPWTPSGAREAVDLWDFLSAAALRD